MKEEYNKALTIRMPDSLRKQLRAAAGMADTSMNEWIVQALRLQIRQSQAKKKD